jgi:hypothetical protein
MKEYRALKLWLELSDAGSSSSSRAQGIMSAAKARVQTTLLMSRQTTLPTRVRITGGHLVECMREEI